MVLGLALDYAFYPLGQTGAPKFDQGANGVWLAFDFARGQSKESPSRLAARMQKDGFRDLFFLVRYIGKSGRLRFDVHTPARQLNAQLKHANPRL